MPPPPPLLSHGHCGMNSMRSRGERAESVASEFISHPPPSNLRSYRFCGLHPLPMQPPLPLSDYATFSS